VGRSPATTLRFEFPAPTRNDPNTGTVAVDHDHELAATCTGSAVFAPFSNEGNVLLSIESVGLNDARPQLAAQRVDGVALVRPGYTGHEVERQILE